MSKSTVIELCGSYPFDYEYIEIGSDPNFVFESDPGFNVVSLWNSAGEKIFVNSFRECEHYVFGGWDRNPVIDTENNLQLILMVYHWLSNHNIIKELDIHQVFLDLVNDQMEREGNDLDHNNHHVKL